ncbi:hypothetical protein [Pantoea ananatis]|uniref:hypothetical protein n=1 Tax=Pantoea ananas TaxID=553 RepID=UPI000CF3AD94|nr:hypothetical protein [Pantoea ananatis]PQL04878.1 hypothetical protein CG434_02840 [Pantoea ananatis]
MKTNSPSPVDGDVQELISEAEAIIELFESAGCLKQVAYRLAKVALASLKAMNNPVGWTDAQELRDVEKDGCGYLFTANPITPNADERRVIMLYTTPPDQLLRPVELPESQRLCNGYYFDMNDVFEALEEAGIPFKVKS